MNLADIQIPSDSKYKNISLAKLCGQPIADIEVSFTREFGDVSVKLLRVVLADGTKMEAEGEHDLPYVTDVPVEAEVLEALYEENNKQWQ
jgi:hypothetical protein